MSWRACTCGLWHPVGRECPSEGAAAIAGGVVVGLLLAAALLIGAR